MSESFTGNIYTDSTEETVLVEFDYSPGQKTILNPVDKSQEGIEPSVELTSVTLHGGEILSGLSQTQYDELIEQCWDYMTVEKEKSETHDRYW